MLHKSIEVRNTFGDGCLRPRGGGGDGAGTHHCSAGVTIRGYPSLLSGSPEQWGVPRERRDRLPCQRVYQSDEQPTVGSGTRSAADQIRHPLRWCARPARACCCARDRARRAPGTTAPLAREWRAAAQRACRACDTLCDGLFCFGVKHSGGSARDRFRARPAFLARHSAYCGARGRVGTPTRRVRVSVRGASSSADFAACVGHTHTNSATLPPH